MKGLLGLLKIAVVGFAVVAGAKSLYRNKERLVRGWRDLGGAEALRDYADNLSVARLLSSVGPLKDLAGQLARLK